MIRQKFQHKSLRLWSWVAILVILLFVCIIRIRLLEVPLERDEGEYAYAGQLMLKGIPPYKESYAMKMPGIYAVYTLIMALFGQTRVGIHIGLLLVNMATIILIFLLGKRLFDPFTGIVSAATFAILSLSQSVQGVFANAEHFVILPVIGGILLLLQAIDWKRLKPIFWSGFLLGIAFVIKQHGGIFVVFAIVYLFADQIIRRSATWPQFLLKIILFSIGSIIPFGLICLFLLLAGVFDKFWFWTFTYASKYISLTTFYHGLNHLNKNLTYIINSMPLIWVFTGVGLTALFWNKKIRPQRLFVETFFIFSFLSICPGFRFRPHYFILLLPAAALLTGVGLSSIKRVRKSILIILTVTILFHSVYKQRIFLFRLSPQMISRATYGFDPFPEMLEIAKYIKDLTSKDDRILVLGSEPQIYFYSGRRSATSYIYAYPLMEPHKYALSMQKEMIKEVESIRPKFIIFVYVPFSWSISQKSERLLFDWFDQYHRKYYRRVGIVDILSLESTVYRWDENCIGYKPRSGYWVSIYKRKI